MFDLSRRVALVTGAGQGVGAEVARTLARQGAAVAVNDLFAARARTVADEIIASGGRAEAVDADITDVDAVGAMVATVEARVGPVDILVNNAGIPPEGITVKTFVETGPDEWDPLIRLNLAAVLGVTRSYLPAMIERSWGRVLTIVSDAGRRGERKQVVYGAAKAAAMGFSRGLAAEVGPHGVTVNCLSLGTMKHGLLEEAIERQPELEQRLAKAYPAGRIGRVTDPAPLAVLLCSDAAEWITGQVYPVDGGYFPAL